MEVYHRVRHIGPTHINNLSKEKQQRWNPPSRGVLKINVDAATNSQEKKVGLAAVIIYNNLRRQDYSCRNKPVSVKGRRRYCKS